MIYEDNYVCTAMSDANKPTPCTHQINIKYHALCEWVEHDLLPLERVDNTINMADYFTKPLGPALFHRHCDYIMGHIPPTYSPVYKSLFGVHDDLTSSQCSHHGTQHTKAIVSQLALSWYHTKLL